MSAKFLKSLFFLESLVAKNLEASNLNMRPAKTNGLWCHALLPLLLLMNCLLHQVSFSYSVTTCISMGLLIYSTLLILFVSVTSLILTQESYGACLAPSMVNILLLCTFFKQSFFVSIAFGFPSILLYSYILRNAFHLPNTFTIGEAMIVCQSIVLFTVASFGNLFSGSEERVLDFMNVIIYTYFILIFFIVAALYFITDQKRNVETLLEILGFGAVSFFVIIHILLGLEASAVLIYYLTMDEIRIRLLAYWLCLVILAGFVVFARAKENVKAGTINRKTFHVFAALAFLPGMLLDVQFMKLAAAGAFGLIILLEAIRKSRIEPFSSWLQAGFDVYADEKDVGGYSMTPIYLFVGLACPLVLVPEYKGYELELLSGVLSIGIGDAAASWFGTNYGKMKWNGTSRTMEGTAANIVSQILTVFFLNIIGLLNIPNALIRTIITSVASSMVEAKTEQVDNLILPIVTMIVYKLTFIL